MHSRARHSIASSFVRKHLRCCGWPPRCPLFHDPDRPCLTPLNGICSKTIGPRVHLRSRSGGPVGIDSGQTCRGGYLLWQRVHGRHLAGLSPSRRSAAGLQTPRYGVRGDERPTRADCGNFRHCASVSQNRTSGSLGHFGASGVYSANHDARAGITRLKSGS